jgi:hypothetical protein
MLDFVSVRIQDLHWEEIAKRATHGLGQISVRAA